MKTIVERAALIFLFFFFLATCAEAMIFKSKEKSSKVQIEKVMDGDTLKLSDGRLIRLVGVDCPEFNKEDLNQTDAARLDIPYPHFVSYAQEAKDYLQNKIEGRSVRMKRDPVLKDRLDPSGRLWVYLQEGKTLINEEIIRQGYCFLHKDYRFQHRKRFLEAEKEARAKKIRIWSKSGQ